MTDEERKKFSGWIANLSNGESVFEGEQIPNERTPWQKLLTRLHETPHLMITSMRLQIAGRTFHTPSHAPGYFQARQFRKAVYSGKESMMYGVGYVLGDKITVTWVNSQGESFMDTIPLQDNIMHTTLARKNGFM